MIGFRLICPEAYQKGIEAGFDAYLVKLDRVALGRAVQKLAAGRTAADVKNGLNVIQGGAA